MSIYQESSREGQVRARLMTAAASPENGTQTDMMLWSLNVTLSEIACQLAAIAETQMPPVIGVDLIHNQCADPLCAHDVSQHVIVNGGILRCFVAQCGCTGFKTKHAVKRSI